MEEIQKETKEASSMDRILESTLSKTVQQMMGQVWGSFEDISFSRTNSNATYRYKNQF